MDTHAFILFYFSYLNFKKTIKRKSSNSEQKTCDPRDVFSPIDGAGEQLFRDAVVTMSNLNNVFFGLDWMAENQSHYYEY